MSRLLNTCVGKSCYFYGYQSRSFSISKISSRVNFLQQPGVRTHVSAESRNTFSSVIPI